MYDMHLVHDLLMNLIKFALLKKKKKKLLPNFSSTKKK